MGWSGRADSLWGQVQRVVESEREFDLFRAAFLRRIAETPTLDAAYRRAFGPLPKTLRAAAPPCETAAECREWWARLSPGSRQEMDDAFVNAAKGIAAFVGGIRPPESRFFALARYPDASLPVALSDSEVRGFRLFAGKGQCTFCHNGSTLSDGEFHNIRLRTRSATDNDDRYAGVAALLASPFNLLGRHNDAPGRIDHTRYVQPDFALLNSFRTPSLVGIGKTAPYMHDGRFATLADVVDYYSEFEGSAEPGHHENVILKPLMLSDAEKADLVAFLQSL
jgi:cytochrome c peroxidase